MCLVVGIGYCNVSDEQTTRQETAAALSADRQPKLKKREENMAGTLW